MDNPLGYRQSLKRYRVGLALAVLLTLAATVLVLWVDLPSLWLMATALSLGLAQIIVHLHCFLHIGLGRDSRNKLNLLLFSALILLLMIAGSLLVFFDQQARMS